MYKCQHFIINKITVKAQLILNKFLRKLLSFCISYRIGIISRIWTETLYKYSLFGVDVYQIILIYFYVGKEKLLENIVFKYLYTTQKHCKIENIFETQTWYKHLTSNELKVKI